MHPGKPIGLPSVIMNGGSNRGTWARLAGDQATAWIQDIPLQAWVIMLGAGILVLALTRRRRPVIKARRESSVGRILWRFTTGAHLDGQVRTDAGWWVRGTRDLTATKRAPQWAYRPRGVRALIRWGSTAIIAMLGWAWMVDSPVLTITTWTAPAVLVAWLGFRTPRAAREVLHRRRCIEPVHRALIQHIGHDRGIRAEKWINIPRQFRQVGSVIQLTLPAGFSDTPRMRQAINNTITNVLSLELHELDVHYHTDAIPPGVNFTVIDPANIVLRPVDDHGPDTAKESVIWRHRRQRRERGA